MLLRLFLGAEEGRLDHCRGFKLEVASGIGRSSNSKSILESNAWTSAFDRYTVSNEGIKSKSCLSGYKKL